MTRYLVSHELSALRRAVSAGHAAMFAIAAKAGAYRLLSADETYDLRRIGKRGAARKVTDARYAQDLIALYASRAAEWAERVAGHERSHQRASTDVAAPHSAPAIARMAAAPAAVALAALATADAGVGVTEVALMPAVAAAQQLASMPLSEVVPITPCARVEDGADDVVGPLGRTPRHARRAAPELGAPRWVAGLQRDHRLPDDALPVVGPEELALMEERLRDYKVAAAVANGESARAALVAQNREPTPANRRRAQRLGARYAKERNIEDARAFRAGAKRTVLTEEMREAIGAFAIMYPTATATGLLFALEKHVADVQSTLAAGRSAGSALLREAIVAGTVRMPSTDTICRALAGFGPDWAMARSKGSEERNRQTRPIKVHEWATRANERWETDHTTLNLTGKQLEGEAWVTTDVYATLVIDAYSRAVMALIISARVPDSMTIAIALRQAVREKDGADGVEPSGTPAVLVMDNGSDFASKQTEAFCAMTGIRQHFCDTYSPDQKPHVERFFDTLKRTLIPLLPGAQGGQEHGDAWSAGRISRLLTVPQIRGEINRWVHDEYQRTPHSKTNEKPVERWRAGAPAQPAIPDRTLDLLLTYTATRRVQRGVVAIGMSGGGTVYFSAPCLRDRTGEDLMLRYNPDDLLSVLAYDASNTHFVGELWNIDDPRTPYPRGAEVSAWYGQRAVVQAKQAGFAQRMAQYHDEVNATDRQRRHHREALEMASDKASRDARQEAMDVDAVEAAAAHAGAMVLEIEGAELRRTLRESAAPTEVQTPVRSAPATPQTSALVDIADALAAEMAAHKHAFSS